MCGVPEGAPGDPTSELLNEVYASLVGSGTPVVVTDYATAKLVKVAVNAFLATKSFKPHSDDV